MAKDDEITVKKPVDLDALKKSREEYTAQGTANDINALYRDPNYTNANEVEAAQEQAQQDAPETEW